MKHADLLSTPAPSTDEALARKAALHACLRQALDVLVNNSRLVFAQVISPALDAPVSAYDAGARSQVEGDASLTTSMHVRLLALPASQHLPKGELLLAGYDEQSFASANALAALLMLLLDAQLGRSAAETTAEQAVAMAHRDVATGLGNRRAWMHTLFVETARVARTGRPLALISLDIDGLKALNDTHGHAAGDDLIVRTAQALSAAARVTDTLCRLGGDEFAIAAPDTDLLQAEQLAIRIQRSLLVAAVPVSLGYAVTEPNGSGAPDSADLWRRADHAMYAQKRARQRERSDGELV